MPQPTLTFFCELAPTALENLFAAPDLIDHLARHNYGVALAILDFSAERASVVRCLNERGVRVNAWLLLPVEEGYWFNLSNYPQAVARYTEFKTWADREGLRFGAIGLDFEPALTDLYAAREQGVGHLWNRAVMAQRNALYPAARQAYLDLAATIRHDGYEVHTYQYPVIVDDRRAGATLIQRTLDIVDLPADQEVLMLYSSNFFPEYFGVEIGGAFVQSYAQHADGIAIGVTGGGVVLDPVTGMQAPRMSLAAFRRDLQIAAQYTDEVHIFSLEGCVARDWLREIETIDWDELPIIPRWQRLRMGLLRSAIGFGLWISLYGWTALGWLGWLVAAGMMISRRVGRWRAGRG